MGTEILRPQDSLVERYPAFHGRRNYVPTKGNRLGNTKTNHNNNNNNNKKRYKNQNERIISSDESKAVSSKSINRNELEIGQVTIVRRGDSLDSLNSRIKKDRTTKTVFEPATLYAGSSAFSSSPSPTSLPLPTFFKKQELKSFDDSATRDLRRLLRLQ